MQLKGVSMNHKVNKELIEFITNSPTAFHTITNIKEQLEADGFTELAESRSWKPERGCGYYVTRNDSSLIAFRLPDKPFTGFQITASHSDSPAFKIKEVPEIEGDKKYTRLNVEGYGGMLCAPWLDRPLSAAGRVVIRNGNSIQTKLVNLDQDLLMIPNLAIHMNRKVNEGYTYNIQKDMLPLIGSDAGKDKFMQLIAQNAGVEESDIVGKDLFLYNRAKGCIWGADKEFISAPRLDDLQCAFGTLKGFLAAKSPGNAAVYCVFDNEEVGSGTKQGAASTFLKDVLKRICSCIGCNDEDYHRFLAGSFMVSADNAHAVHPNFADKSDTANRVYMNNGIVLKHSANQKYTTDAVSGGILREICKIADVPVQSFVNRSDIPGGSTLGNIANTQTSVNTVDIGLAQLAMHSPYETAGARDTKYLIKATQAFYSTVINCSTTGNYILTN